MTEPVVAHEQHGVGTSAKAWVHLDAVVGHWRCRRNRFVHGHLIRPRQRDVEAVVMHAAFQCQCIAVHAAPGERDGLAFFQLNVVAASLRHGTDSAAQHEDQRQRHERLHKSTEAVIAHERQHKHRSSAVSPASAIPTIIGTMPSGSTNIQRIVRTSSTVPASRKDRKIAKIGRSSQCKVKL